MLSFNESLKTKKESDITYHTRIKHYPDGSWEMLTASRAIFRPSGWEPAGERVKRESGKRSESLRNLERSRRRAAARLRDYALCTDFGFFVTLTFAQDRVDRYDIKKILSMVRAWLDNRVRRKGLVYVLVPEYHRDGAIHFHGFFNNAEVGMVDSGTIDMEGFRKPRKPRSEAERQRWLSEGGRVVYNISDWEFGFSTAIELYGDKAAAVGYCVKYLSKQKEKIGGRWYYSGGILREPVVTFSDASYEEVLQAVPGAYVIEIPEANLAMVITRGLSKSLELRGGD